MSLEFKEWMEVHFNEPYECINGFDLDDVRSNSPNAIMRRYRDSYWRHIKWECKTLYKELKYFYTEGFKGLDTPVSWFIGAVIYPPLLPFLPFIRTHFLIKRTMKKYKEEYYQEYLRDCNNE